MHGFTLIEALTVLFIFGVVVTTFYETWSLGTKYIMNTKNRLGKQTIWSQRQYRRCRNSSGYQRL
jgi:prepilin-type N-terminal cleavage/methylation domain-containing protein